MNPAPHPRSCLRPTPADGRWQLIGTDGNVASAPSGRPLVFPSVRIANAVARSLAPAEPRHRAIQKTRMQHAWIRLANTVTDQIEPNRPAACNALIARLQTDCLLYLDETSAPLIAAYQKHCKTTLDWARRRFGHMEITTTLQSPGIPCQTRAELANEIKDLASWHLAALSGLANALDSVILSLAWSHQKASFNDIWLASTFERHTQTMFWGNCPEGERSARQARHAAMIAAYQVWLTGTPAPNAASPSRVRQRE